MVRNDFVLAPVLLLVAFALGSCNDTGTSTNTNTNPAANANSRMRAETTPAATATPTPKYTEEQAREERERAKANKETVGQSLADAWIHTKIVAKLIGNTQTPERKINVDVVEGAVTLRGTVDTAEAKTETERIAKETDGVKKVTNQLKVAPPPKTANTNANTSGIKNKGKTP
ncbi:MAG TPA: BON domain-containing protein [Pyrinomonadaceae bacterium]|nr:BON domain-containing protein [Pyrinomonadaceae bacterium]